MKITQSGDEMTDAATALLRECVEGLQASLKRFDAEAPGRRPRAYMRYRDALMMSLSVMDAVTSGNARTAGTQLKTAQKAVQNARQAMEAEEAPPRGKNTGR